MGHLVGGFPFTRGEIAAEGQADYYATQACARLMWQDEVETNKSFALTTSDHSRQLCGAGWDDTSGRQLCYRLHAAIEKIADFWVWKNELDVTPSIGTPSSDVVDATITKGYPGYQCRVDTLVAGSLCLVEFDHSMRPRTYEEMSQSSCVVLDDGGARPKCWFHPSE